MYTSVIPMEPEAFNLPVTISSNSSIRLSRPISGNSSTGNLDNSTQEQFAATAEIALCVLPEATRAVRYLRRTKQLQGRELAAD